MKIVIVNGSARKKGRTGIASRHFEKSYGTELIDLSQLKLPIFNGEEDQYHLEEVKNLKEKIGQADGIILASPEYHSGMSGALKNALDFLGSQQFAHKPLALLAVSGGGKGGINTLNNMRIVARGLYANVIPRQLVLDPDCFDYENDSLLPEADALAKQLMDELSRYIKINNLLKEQER
ncbi:MAG: NAD(P)H-dependent oxidoreductase [Bacillota bacterium]|nr:NAD(P)H-dependent oxidoreductase [Bacillota bacterium]MDP4171485.1 NAD(P)H-dependent oxidoreductase [Bacillota bacterium]